MDQGLTYQALATGDLDVNVSFSTDGRIAKFNLVNWRDDAHFFPPLLLRAHHEAGVCRREPRCGRGAHGVGRVWSDEDMQGYNLLVDEGADARDVPRRCSRTRASSSRRAEPPFPSR
jgi:glycine betaine/choline ABC-type transport system substrate-binding protein